MSKEQTETKETLESYKAQVKLDMVRIKYRYILVISILLAFAAGIIGGYFKAFDVISDAQNKVVNSITLTSKQ